MKKRSSILRVYKENKRYWGAFALIFGLTMLAGVFKMLSSTFWGDVVDYGIGGEINLMLSSAVFMAVIILLDCTRTSLLYHYMGASVEKLFVEYRTRAFERLNKGDVAVLENDFRSGDTATRINNDIDKLNDFMGGAISNHVRVISQAVFSAIACIFLTWELSLAYFILLPFSIWFLNKISKPIEKQAKQSMDKTGSSASLATDVINGILTVKAFCVQPIMNKKFKELTDKSFEATVNSEKINRAMTGVRYATSVVQTMVLFFVGAVLVSNNLISVGDLVAFITLSVYVSQAFENIDYTLRTFRDGEATAQRVYEVLDIPLEKEGTFTGRNEGELVKIDNLKFSYGDTEILKGINLKINSSQKVALIGPSGCGKSTMVKLLCRFYLPNSGTFEFKGEDISLWDGDALRENMAIVSQESVLFDGSVYENISYGGKNITKEQAEYALKEVGLWAFVCSLKDGINHQIGEFGGTLSGGQRQRICIARAMVKNAPLVILDEATSALDTSSENEVQKALDKLLVGKAAVIVAHRLTTIQNVDYIYYFEDGVVAEEGSPHDLLERKGKYYAMCLSQGLVKAGENNDET